MAIRRSTGFRNKLLGTGSAKATFTNCIVTIYTGAQPASADDAKPATSTQLAQFTAVNYGTAAAGVIPLSAAIQADITASGVAGWFRICESGDTPANASTTLARIDGAIATSGGDLNLPGGTTLTLTVPATPLIIGSLDLSIPA